MNGYWTYNTNTKTQYNDMQFQSYSISWIKQKLPVIHERQFGDTIKKKEAPTYTTAPQSHMFVCVKPKWLPHSSAPDKRQHIE